MAREILFGTGWRPDEPSARDYTRRHAAVHSMLESTGIPDAGPGVALPQTADLRQWCAPVQFQGYYNTCTCHVISSMIELLERVARDRYVECSRLFLYQVTKRLLGETGDPGVYLRQMMGALVLLGVPPERYFPYLKTAGGNKNDPRLEAEPDAFCYALARDFGAARYYRLDPVDAHPDEVLGEIRAHLATRVPVSLGFPLFHSVLVSAATSGELALPPPSEDPVANHAALVVGYDDERKIQGSKPGAVATRGAFLLQNSWGTDWGKKGFGWLPYEYLLQGMARDVWVLIDAQWIETDRFQLGLEQ